MDFPIVFIWDEIFARYPDSKVILLVRDYDRIHRWIKSYLNLLQQVNRFHAIYKIINVFYPVKSFQFEMDVWNKYHDGSLSEFLSRSKLEQAIDLKMMYTIYIDKVKETVPNNQLLIMH